MKPADASIARSAHRLLISLILLQLAACAAPPPRPELPPYVHHDLRPPVETAEVLALTPEMQAFVDRFVDRNSEPAARVSLLNTAIFDSAMLGYRYDDRMTLTAQEAFAQRSGNCLAFSNLVVALARAAGLDARYQEVFVAPQWQAREDTVVIARHVNVWVRTGVHEWILDPTGLVLRPGDRRRLLEDDEALAYYYNNLAVDAMVSGDHHRAFALLAKSVDTAPDLPDTWVNLGVLYGRNGQTEDAIGMYQSVLAHDPDQFSALANLLALYETHEDPAALAIAPRVERYRQRNPYYLLYQGEESLEAGDFARAREYLQGAIAKKPEEHRFHFALARTEYLAGNLELAETSLARARELAPADLVADYDRPLADLAVNP